MQFIKKPWTVCSDITIVIVVCSVLIRVLSIWYVVGGFILKYDEPLLSDGGIEFLNNVFLGSLPLGSFINALVLSLVPSIVVHTVNAAVTFFGFCRKSKGCLIASASINFLMIIYQLITIAVISWLLDELNFSIYRSLKKKFDMNPWGPLAYMNCCGFDSDSSTCLYSLSSPPPCFDYIKETLNSYGGSFIAVLVVNILVSAVMVIGTEYLYRYEKLKSKQSQDPDLWNMIPKSELYNSRNGMFAKILSFLTESWERNVLASKFGYLSVFIIMLDGGIFLAIIFVRYNFYDLTMSDELSSIYAYGKFYINMGYLKDALLITFLCLLVWSIAAKTFYFTGIYQNRKCLLASFMCSEILVLAVECIICVFASYLLRILYCCDWNRTGLDSCHFSYGNTTPLPICDRSWANAAKFIWVSIWILILHVFLKIFYIARADNVFKHLMPKDGITETHSVVQKCGFFYSVYLSSKRHPLTAVVIGVSILISIVDCIYFCGLLVVRYGKPSYGLLTDTLHDIRLGSLNMSANRDNAILINVVSLSVSFCLQCGKFISIGLLKPKVTLLMLWLELPLIILQLSTTTMTIILIKLVHCCSGSANCLFSVNGANSAISSSEFCDSNIRDHADLQFWLMLGFGILTLILQVLSIILGYVYFKRSADGKLGIFKGVFELFKSIWCEIKKIRMLRMSMLYIQRFTKSLWQKITGKLEKYTIIQKLYFSIQILLLVLNLLFWIGLFRVAYYPGYLHTSGLLSNISNVQLSFGSGDMTTTINGIMFSLMAVIPISSYFQVMGIGSLLKQHRSVFKVITACVVVFSTGDIIYLVFCSEILHFGYCYCKNSSACEDYNITTVVLLKETCGPLFLEPAGVLVAYVVVVFIIHITVLFLSINIFRQIQARVGIVDENEKLISLRSQQKSFMDKDSKSETEKLPRNLSGQQEEKKEDTITGKFLGNEDSATEDAHEEKMIQTVKAHTLKEEKNENMEIVNMEHEKNEGEEQSDKIFGNMQNLDTGFQNQENELAENQMMDPNNKKSSDDQNETVEKNETSGEILSETDSINVTEGGEKKKKKKGRKKKDKKRKERHREEHDKEQTNKLDSPTTMDEDDSKTNDMKIKGLLAPGVETSEQDSRIWMIDQH